jgi:hypothetical protein
MIAKSPSNIVTLGSTFYDGVIICLLSLALLVLF